MKYYLIFINTLADYEVVSIATFDDEESQESAYQSYSSKLKEHGFDWLSFSQVEYHKIQKFAELR